MYFRATGDGSIDSGSWCEVETLTLNRMVLHVFIGHRGCQGQSITPDTGSDIRDTEGQSAPVLLVNESWHCAGFRILVCFHIKKKKNIQKNDRIYQLELL